MLHIGNVLSLAAAMLLLTVSSSALETGTPHSTVQPLTKEHFRQAIEDPANGLWFLKFYAPWCGHCKRMAPILEEVAPMVAGKMAIGTIDCTVEKSLCDEFSVRGYPTLKFSRDGEIFDYEGARLKDDILMFANKMSAPAVTLCDTHDDALQLAATTDNGLVFVAYHPDVQGEKRTQKLQSTHLSQVFAQVARVNQAYSTFCLLSPQADIAKFNLADSEHGFVAKIEADVPAKVLPGTEDISAKAVSNFVKEHNVPLVSEFGPKNFHTLARNGKILFIGAVDPSDALQVAQMKTDLKTFALGNDDYYFGWMDGKTWQKFLSQFDILPADLPQVFALNVPKKTFWQDPEYSAKGIPAFVAAIQDGTIESRQIGRPKKGLAGFGQEFQGFMVKYSPWSVVALVGVCVLIVVMILPNGDELRPPYPKDSDESKKDAAPAAKAATPEEAAKDESKKDK